MIRQAMPRLIGTDAPRTEVLRKTPTNKPLDTIRVGQPFNPRTVKEVASPIINRATNVNIPKAVDAVKKIGIVKESEIKNTMIKSGIIPKETAIKKVVELIKADTNIEPVETTDITIVDKITAFWNKGIVYKIILIAPVVLLASSSFLYKKFFKKGW